MILSLRQLKRLTSGWWKRIPSPRFLLLQVSLWARCLLFLDCSSSLFRLTINKITCTNSHDSAQPKKRYAFVVIGYEIKYLHNWFTASSRQRWPKQKAAIPVSERVMKILKKRKGPMRPSKRPWKKRRRSSFRVQQCWTTQSTHNSFLAQQRKMVYLLFFPHISFHCTFPPLYDPSSSHSFIHSCIKKKRLWQWCNIRFGWGDVSKYTENRLLENVSEIRVSVACKGFATVLGNFLLSLFGTHFGTAFVLTS